MKTISVAFSAIIVLSGCASIPQKEQNKAEITPIKHIEIFYHRDSYSVVVGQADGFLALTSIGESERIEKRSKEISNAIQDSFPEKNLNLTFAKKLAEQIKASGRNVKLTEINRPDGDLNIFLTPAFISAPKTPGYAPLVLRITTGFGARSFMYGFGPIVDVTYLLASAEGGKELVNFGNQSHGKGETYMRFDSLLNAHKKAYEALQLELLNLAPEVYSNLF